MLIQTVARSKYIYKYKSFILYPPFLKYLEEVYYGSSEPVAAV